MHGGSSPALTPLGYIASLTQGTTATHTGARNQGLQVPSLLTSWGEAVLGARHLFSSFPKHGTVNDLPGRAVSRYLVRARVVTVCPSCLCLHNQINSQTEGRNSCSSQCAYPITCFKKTPFFIYTHRDYKPMPRVAPLCVYTCVCIYTNIYLYIKKPRNTQMSSCRHRRLLPQLLAAWLAFFGRRRKQKQPANRQETSHKPECHI